MKFYKCAVCGNIIAYAEHPGCDAMCCGKPIEEVVPGTTDAAVEKHVPAVSRDGDLLTVSVGTVLHPMLEEHFIKWIALETSAGYQFKYLAPGSDPVVQFALTPGEEVKSCVAYCNLHGLWADR